jgi:hypothetical protein
MGQILQLQNQTYGTKGMMEGNKKKREGKKIEIKNKSQ